VFLEPITLFVARLLKQPRILLQLIGVGPNVADFICLMALD